MDELRSYRKGKFSWGGLAVVCFCRFNLRTDDVGLDIIIVFFVYADIHEIELRAILSEN